MVKKYVIKNILDIELLRIKWLELEKGIDMTIFQSFEWNKLLLQEYLNSQYSKLFSEMIIYVLLRDNDIKIILPIIVQKHSTKIKWFGREKGIFILGHDSYSDYINAIYSKAIEKDFDELFKFINLEYKNYYFIINDIKNETMLANYLSKTKLSRLKDEVSIQIDLPDTEDVYAISLSKHVRQNLRTSLNRINKDNISYKIEIINGNIVDMQTIEKLTYLHIKRMISKNTNKKDIIHLIYSCIKIAAKKYKEENNNIVRNSMMTLENSVFVIVNLNNEIAGYLYGLRDGNIIRILQNCVNDKFRYYSPMFRGTYDFIIRSIQNDIETIDFTRGNESYKYQLNGTETILRNFKGKTI